MAQLLDTLLVSAAARCRPPRREEAVALLASSSKGGNRCVEFFGLGTMLRDDIRLMEDT